VKLWIDECLSPGLVATANTRGYQATCNRDRGKLRWPDRDLHRAVAEEGFVFVTNNYSDFRSLCASVDLHPGLIVMPQELREDQPALLIAALDHIDRRRGKAPAADWMINRVLEMREDTHEIHDYQLP